MKTIRVRYYDLLQDQRGITEEAVKTFAGSPEELYDELRLMHRFSLASTTVRSSVNNEVVPMNTPLWEGDLVAFIPPIAN
jgi:molybdopterin converting factor small subunit